MKIFVLWLAFVAVIFTKEAMSRKNWKIAKEKSIVLTIMFAVVLWVLSFSNDL